MELGTPTSILQTPQDAYRPSPYQSQASNLPEYSMAPEVAKDYEGLQVDSNGPYPRPTTEETSPKWWRPTVSSQKQVAVINDGALIPVKKDPFAKKKGKTCGMSRKTFIIVILVILLVIVGATAGGIGGYYATKASKKPWVTSGTTGMAKPPCTATDTVQPNGIPAIPRGVANPYITTGATFNITCRRGVPVGALDGGLPVGEYQRFVTYTLEDCMNKCGPDPQCGGVVYGANLTAMVQDGSPGANCLLKNGTWEATLMKEPWFASAVKE